LDQRFPEHWRDSVQNYIEKGHPVGGFLYAVFCNDLVDAFNRADSINSRRLHDFAEFLCNYAPQACYGSKNLFELRRQFLFGGCLQLLELLGRNICARQNARRLQCRVGAWRENLVMG